MHNDIFLKDLDWPLTKHNLHRKGGRRSAPFCIMYLWGVIACVPSLAVQTTPAFDIQGHRGARGLLPENTMDAFLRASDMAHVQTLELDVAVTADSTVVVSHEPWMSEQICSDITGRAITNGKVHNIFRMSYEAVIRYDCGSRQHPDFPHQETRQAVKPRLEDIIRAVEEHAAGKERAPLRFNIEIKSRPEWDGIYTPDVGTFAQLVHQIVYEAGIEDRVIVQSFDRRSLRAAHQLSTVWQTALLVSEKAALPEAILGLGFTPDIYSPAHRHVTVSLVQTAHSLGMHIVPWTVNTAADMVRLRTMGVDGIITDYPDRAVAVADL